MRAKTISVLTSLLLLSLISCGGGDSDNNPANGGDEPTIRIGLLTSLTGALERLGPSHRAAAEMATREINAAGGILGRQIELVIADSETDPVASGQNAQTLIAKGVAAIVGPGISSATLKVANEITIPQEILLVSHGATSAAITSLDDNDLVWRTAASDNIKAKIAAGVAFDLGAQKVGVIFIDNSFGRGLAEEFATQYAALGGEVVNNIAYPELTGDEISSYDYRIHVDLVMDGEPDLIYMITFADDGSKIAIAADARVSDAYRPLFLAELPPSTGSLAEIGIYDGLYGVEQESPDSPNHAQFAREFRAQFDSDPDLFADSIYDALYLIALAIEQAGSAESPAIAAELRAISAGGTQINVGEIARGLELIRQNADIDYEGASGSINFDANGDVASATYRVWKVENGAFVNLETITFP